MLSAYLPRSAELLADCTIQRNGLLNKKWSYDYGVVWRGMEMLYALTGNEKYFAYIFGALDGMVDETGVPTGYDREAYNLDYLCIGRQLIYLWQKTDKEKFRKAAALLRSQLDGQPRTSDGGFWHKKVYPWQMWLDGQHMAVPFFLQYEAVFGPDEAARNDAARAWDQAVGWYMTALADTFPWYVRKIRPFFPPSPIPGWIPSACSGSATLSLRKYIPGSGRKIGKGKRFI